MSEKIWKEIQDDCPVCGNMAECYTDCPGELYYDGDEVRCDECHYPGWITVADEMAGVSWCEEGYPVEAAERIENLKAEVFKIRERILTDFAQLEPSEMVHLEIAEWLEGMLVKHGFPHSQLHPIQEYRVEAAESIPEEELSE